MRLLGVIPARGGSKGVPRKNLAPLGGRPLIAYTCDAARGSTRLGRTIVSTDDEEIANVARASGAEVPFLRPAELSGDDVPILEVLLHALETVDEADAVVLLQPTSPLRTARHVDEAVDLFAASGADSVVSVVRVPHAFTPGSLLRLDGGRLVPMLDGEQAQRRQDKPLLYARNGPAVLVVRAETLRTGSLYGDDSRPYEMDAASSVDIDSAVDLELAERLLGRNG
jgi:CMP-N,N'-diacetyllegionaminic acid synthase